MTAPEVSTVDAGPRKVSRRVTVPVPADEIFALVADPHRHPELDGSGTVRDSPVSGPTRLALGAKFSVGMKQYGVPYRITSTVTGYQDGTVVEWRHPMGHRWRWELRPTAPGTTEVTETFDYSTSRAPKLMELFGQPQANAKGITKTLQALCGRFPADGTRTPPVAPA